MSWRIFILLLAQAGGDAGPQAALALQAGDYTTANQILVAALEQSPRDARLLTLEGLTLVRLGDSDGALASFNRALQSAPTYYPALEGAAQIELRTGRPEAVATLRRMLTIRPTDTSALRGLAFLLMKQKQAAEALPILQRLATVAPTDEKVVLDLAAAQFLTAHYSGVISTLTPLAAKQPPDVDALHLLAQAYNLTGQTEKALAFLQTAMAASPATPESYLDFVNICLAHGLFQQGIDAASVGLLRIPDSAPLYVARGVLYSELADYDKGEADFQRAEQLDPNVEGGSFAKGLAELQRNDLAQAEATVRERLRLQPRDAYLQYLLAEVLTRKGAAPGAPEFQEALAAARKSVDLKPDFALARDLLGRLYVQDGNIEEGIRQSRVALHLNPSDQKALYHLILALRKAHRTEEVPALLQQLVKLREEAGKQEAAQHDYALVDQTSAAGSRRPLLLRAFASVSATQGNRDFRGYLL